MTQATDANGNVREWCVKCTYPDGEVTYGSARDRESADSWVRIDTRFYGGVLKFETVHISEAKQNSPSPDEEFCPKEV